MTHTTFKVGERVDPKDLISWSYTGLSGKPGKDKSAVRRFRKGMWILEMQAHINPAQPSRVVSLRTTEEDQSHWQETRQRLKRNNPRS